MSEIFSTSPYSNNDEQYNISILVDWIKEQSDKTLLYKTTSQIGRLVLEELGSAKVGYFPHYCLSQAMKHCNWISVKGQWTIHES